MRDNGNHQAALPESISGRENKNRLRARHQGSRAQELAFRAARREKRVLPPFAHLEQDLGRTTRNPQELKWLRGVQRKDVRRPFGALLPTRCDRRRNPLEAEGRRPARGTQQYRARHARVSRRLADNAALMQLRRAWRL